MLTAEDVVKCAESLGYASCGIVSTAAMQGYTERLTERIERFPESRERSAWLYGFGALEKSHPWAKAIVVCAAWYGRYQIPAVVKGRIANYYLCDGRRDAKAKEHESSLRLEQYLKGAGMQTATERDFGLCALRWAAMQAGLGLVRKNNFFYTAQGSWVHLEAFLIDAPLEYRHKSECKPCPKDCTLCIEACPTKSLSAPYEMCRSSCISCLTTWDGWDLRGEPHNAAMGQWIFGCDACQNACPHNKNAWREEEAFPDLNELCERLSLEQIVAADNVFLETVLQGKLWYIPKGKVWRYKTNALNAMRNDFKASYLPAVRLALTDAHEEVRQMAAWVLTQVGEQA